MIRIKNFRTRVPKWFLYFLKGREGHTFINSVLNYEFDFFFFFGSLPHENLNISKFTGIHNYKRKQDRQSQVYRWVGGRRLQTGVNLFYISKILSNFYIVIGLKKKKNWSHCQDFKSANPFKKYTYTPSLTPMHTFTRQVGCGRDARHLKAWDILPSCTT